MIHQDNFPDDNIPLENLFPDVPRGTFQTLRQYAKLVWDWNHQINLTGAKSLSEFYSRHIIDCLASRGVLSLATYWMDIGSGSGLPGIVWAALEPSKYFLLVESLQKKVSFLHRAKSLLSLDQIKIESRRLEDIPLEALPSGESWAFVSRGTAAPPEMLRLAQTTPLPWKQWFIFSTKKTHSEFLTLTKKFGMKAEVFHYQIPSLSGPGQEGILTILERKG
jgi:16S rRNA (guanine(527)-N(7))-methyltransferase RsmG